jgi:hypothetical protein
MHEDDFGSTFASTNAFSGEKDLPASYPKKSVESGGPESMTCKYASFFVNKDGNADLEAVMNDCLKGKKLLVTEKWNTTKEGDTIVTIKYYIPEDAKKSGPELNVIKGRRRLEKAMRGKQ